MEESLEACRIPVIKRGYIEGNLEGPFILPRANITIACDLGSVIREKKDQITSPRSRVEITCLNRNTVFPTCVRDKTSRTSAEPRAGLKPLYVVSIVLSVAIVMTLACGLFYCKCRCRKTSENEPTVNPNPTVELHDPTDNPNPTVNPE